MKRRYWIGFPAMIAVLLVAGVKTHAQTGRAPTAPPPITWPSPALPDGPIVLETGIQRQIRVEIGRAHV